MKKAHKIFLSHSSKDRELAKGIERALEKRGFEVWLSGSELIGAEQWHLEIGRALERCDWFILLATPAACRKPRKRPWWIQREVNHALSQDRYEGRFTPVLCGVKVAQLKKISWFLPQIQHVKLGHDLKSACELISQQLKPRRRR